MANKVAYSAYICKRKPVAETTGRDSHSQLLNWET